MKLKRQWGLGIPLNIVGIIAIILDGMVTCKTILTSICGGGNVEIWFTCNGNGAGSNVNNWLWHIMYM